MKKAILIFLATALSTSLVLATDYELTVNIIGSGTVDPNSGIYPNGTTVTIETWPQASQWVKSWSGTDNDSSTELFNTVTMTSNKTVTVEFGDAIIVNKPPEGEIWTSGSTHKITWTSYGAGEVDVLFSTDAGDNWQGIVPGTADTGSYTWALPGGTDSSQCVVKVVPKFPNPDATIIPGGLFTIHPGFVHPQVAAKWKSLGGDFDRSGLSNDNGPELGCVKWQFQTNGPVSSSAVIGAGDRVYISCEDGKVYSLDLASGSFYWSCDTNSTLLSSPSVGQRGEIYLGGDDNKLYAISIAGDILWTHTTDGFIYSTPAVSQDGKVFFCSSDGIVYALDSDGSELWTFETAGFDMLGNSVLGSPSIGLDGTVYVAGFYDPNLYALDPTNGSKKWAYNFKSGGWPFASPVVAENGLIYQTLLHDPNIYVIHPLGFIMGAADLLSANSNWSEPALGPDGTIYVNFDDAHLRAINPNGTIKWTRRLGVVGGFTITVGNDGLIYAAGDDGHIYVVNESGEEISRFQSDGLLSFPVIAQANTIIVSDSNNMVWAIGTDCSGESLALHRPQDINKDGIVDFNDVAVLSDDWLKCTDIYTSSHCEPIGEQIYPDGDIDRDLYVDLMDFAVLANRWLMED